MPKAFISLIMFFSSTKLNLHRESSSPIDQMDHQKNRAVDFAMIITLLFFGALYICLCLMDNHNFKLLQKPISHPKLPTFNMTLYKDELDEVLANASTENKTVIIAVVNKAYVEGDKSMLDLFLDGFWVGDGTRELTDHLLIVAVDQTSFERCKFLRLHCYKLETDGVDFVGEKLYMSEEFIKMMWRRTLFLAEVLKRGYNFIFTDTDIIWLRNPFLWLNQSESIDFQISTDKFMGNPWSESNPINTGFYMIRSNNKTIALFDEWYSKKDSSARMKEQDVLFSLMRQGVFRSLGLTVRFLDTLYFSGFCQDSKDIRIVSTVHANCCRTIGAKMIDLTAVIHDWNRFKSLPANETSTIEWSPHTACVNSWRHR